MDNRDRHSVVIAALCGTGVPPVNGQSQDPKTRAGRPCYEKRLIITSSVEHSSVLNYCMALGASPCSGGFTPPSGLSPFANDNEPKPGVPEPPLQGYRVPYLPVDRDGLLKLADLEAAITDQTAVVSLMRANNETGVLFPAAQIAEICRARGVLYHCDAVQAAAFQGPGPRSMNNRQANQQN